MKPIIELDNLTKSYGANRGVIALNLTVQKGEIFGFLGPNGAGKSTTIRCMLGLIHYHSGNIRILGKDTQTQLIDILSQVGYMPSEAMFYPSMKVSEVIKLAADARGLDCSAEAARICERLQVNPKKRIDELSLGNRKKVSIVCAMQHNPELYIFDEPTSGLDPLMQKEFFDLILERNQQGATCFLSSHVLSEIKKYCHRVAIIKEGRLICTDTVENLSAGNTKKIHLRGNQISLSTQTTAWRVLDQLPGIRQLVKNGDEIDFIYSGDIHPLMDQMQKLPYTDLCVEEPALDEIFLHFYEKEEA